MFEFGVLVIFKRGCRLAIYASRFAARIDENTSAGFTEPGGVVHEVVEIANAHLPRILFEQRSDRLSPAFVFPRLLPQPSLDCFDVHLEPSKCGEHVRRPKRYFLCSFAMWTAFPSSDYYEHSAIRSPGRRRIRVVEPLRHYPLQTSDGGPQYPPFTRPDFPGSLISTQTFPFRLQPISTNPAVCRFPRTLRSNWLVRSLVSLATVWGLCVHRSHSPVRANPYSGLLGRTASVLAGLGAPIFPKVLADSFRSHAETLPGRTPTAMKPCLCPPLSGELSSRSVRI